MHHRFGNHSLLTNPTRALDIDTGHLYAIKRIKIELQEEVDQEMMVNMLTLTH
jgi:hypothetical protein